ncbi:MAG: hypothetical protein OFPII_43450 [Osedax symbiont Rs1]|nr:MAG: hypothetical protein OFPII_43450 [Osedax symbiont Rs1]
MFFVILFGTIILTSLNDGIELVLKPLKDWYLWLIIIPLLCFCFRVYFSRYLVPSISKWFKSKRINQSSDKMSDIRDEIKNIQALSYNPQDYFIDNQVFCGLDKKKEPLYIPLKEWEEINKTVVGATRFGKGITFQIWIAQAIRRGECVFYVDPKGDKFIPKIMKAEAHKIGRRFVSLDLTGEGTGKWHPFKDGSIRDKKSRFETVMGLADKGTDADHYKALARDVMLDIFSQEDKKTTLENLYAQIKNISDPDKEKAASTLKSKLREWHLHAPLNPKTGKGFNVENSILNNAVVYIKGSMDDAIVRDATKAIIIEILQQIKSSNDQRKTHVSLYIDELRFLISKPIVDALATILGFNADIVTAYQSFGDLRTPDDRSLDGRAIEQAVKTNSQIKLIFGGTDKDTAEYVAELSGTLQKSIIKFERTEINALGAETWSSGRTMSDEEEAVISENTVLSLPSQVAVFFRPQHIAKITHVSFIPLETKIPGT